ncbi:MAG TPA: DUF3147 family protein [Candidatus Dormibacteraeota bacterium]|jgi:hypothetical protein
MKHESPIPSVRTREIRANRFTDYAIRFCFGAAISLVAGLIGLKFGPRVGGIFLGFPAVLPASLTLIQKKSGKTDAAIDSEGAVLGSVALVAFAIFTWLVVVRLGVPLTLALALIVWVAVAVGLYAVAMMVLHGGEPVPR